MKACNQCGKCCLKYGGSDLATTTEELALWEIFNPDIYQFVKNNQIWFDPKSRKKLSVCPFLELTPNQSAGSDYIYTCSIYLNRPEDCRLYPSLISEMIRDECEMIEIIDIQSPQAAQSKLDSAII